MQIKSELNLKAFLNSVEIINHHSYSFTLQMRYKIYHFKKATKTLFINKKIFHFKLPFLKDSTSMIVFFYFLFPNSYFLLFIFQKIYDFCFT